MKCWKCDKELDRPKEAGYKEDNPVVQGIVITVTISENQQTPETIKYNKLQLGKYANENGECKVAICYECYIDGLFHVRTM